MDVRKFLEERLEVKQKESEDNVEYRLRLYNEAYEIDGEEFDKLPDPVAQWINDCILRSNGIVAVLKSRELIGEYLGIL